MRALQGIWPFLTAFAGALAGAYLGVGLAQPRPAPLEEQERGPGPARVAFASALASPGSRAASDPVRATLDAGDRRALALEVASLLKGALAEPSQAEPARAPPSADALQARREADQLLDHALAAREWTEQDVEALRLLLARLTDADRQSVMQLLAQSINAGRLAVRVLGSPF